MTRAGVGRNLLFVGMSGAVALGLASVGVPVPLLGSSAPMAAAVGPAAAPTASPIKHVVVIFQENVSFDHYFGTYPNAANTSGQPFTPAAGTPSVNGLTPQLLTNNPNGANPRRLNPATVNDLLVCDQDHGYTDEQTAFDGGKMDKFTTVSSAYNTSGSKSPTGQACQPSDVLNYYDGNSVTGLWNYAQHFAMSDNSFGTTFGPSAPGAINLASGNTGTVDTNPAHIEHGAGTDGDVINNGQGGLSLISDAQPYYDDCTTRDAVAMTGQNVGDQLNTAGLSWGWFQGGFTANTAYSGAPDGPATYAGEAETGRATCTTSHPVGVAVGGTGQYGTKGDYIEHHEPFQYYASTANPHHLAPTSLAAVGTDTAAPGQFNTANHQYDTTQFDQLVSSIQSGTLPASNFPAVSFLKAPGYQDGHAGYSDPLDEQAFVTNEINSIEKLPTWSSTAIIIAYDDSDGFYDHVYSGVTNPSQTTADVLTGAGQCGTGAPVFGGGQQGRCGYGPRLPLMVISPYAKQNYVSHTLTDQSSILKFIDWNWSLGTIAGSASGSAGSINDLFNFNNGGTTPAVMLNTQTGQPTSVGPNPNDGYRQVGTDGSVYAFGNAKSYGSMAGTHLNKPMVGMASTPDGAGYWEVASDGGVFAFGDAAFYGSMGGVKLNKPIVGIASTPDGAGYWEVASDGGVFAFGDAAFYGSMGGVKLNKPVVGITTSPDGGGYWEVASDGGVFAFGDAAFYGSMGGTPLNKPVVGITASPDGAGYWEVASDGGVFSFGDAPFLGSMGGTPLNKPIVGVASSTAGNGYWEFASDGGVFSFGGSSFQGSVPGLGLTVKDIVGGSSPL
jgi:phospholipase C